MRKERYPMPSFRKWSKIIGILILAEILILLYLLG